MAKIVKKNFKRNTILVIPDLWKRDLIINGEMTGHLLKMLKKDDLKKEEESLVCYNPIAIKSVINGFNSYVFMVENRMVEDDGMLRAFFEIKTKEYFYKKIPCTVEDMSNAVDDICNKKDKVLVSLLASGFLKYGMTGEEIASMILQMIDTLYAVVFENTETNELIGDFFVNTLYEKGIRVFGYEFSDVDFQVESQYLFETNQLSRGKKAIKFMY